MTTFYPTLLRHIISSVVLLLTFYGVSRFLYPTTWLELIAVAVICIIIGSVVHMTIVMDKGEIKMVFKRLKS